MKQTKPFEQNSQDKHTPGEWKVEPTKGWYAIIGNGSRIATVESRFGDFSDEAGANARLIAAAPDLLAACKGMINAHELGLWKTTNGSDNDVLDGLKRTLAKTENV